jgi:creatinine amidohydrolase
LKAEWLCQETAKKVGGIVAPSMGYHIHESGYHAAWLEETVGEENPHMTAMPPAIFLSFFLYQLRAFINAGFKSVIVISGHSGGNQEDLRNAASVFMKYIPVNIWVRSDPELIEGLYTGDHAGKYEISQLMHIRPDLIDMKAVSYEKNPESGGRLALGSDADEANPELGKNIMEACLHALCSEVSQMKQEAVEITTKAENISYSMIEKIRIELLESSSEWITSKPWPGQREVSPHSQWKPYENYN